METMARLGFACMSVPGSAEAVMLARSLRTFGGAFQNSPFRVMIPGSLGPLPETG
jgi:hypothetical protein